MAPCRWVDGELGKGARSRCNIDKGPGSPIAADRREERDDVPRGMKALAPRDPDTDTDEEGTAVRKMRKIKSDMTPAPDPKRGRPPPLRSDTEGNGTDRSPRPIAGNRSRSPGSRLREPEEHYPDADFSEGRKGARRTRRAERTGPDRSRTMKSGGEADRSERDEETSPGKKNSKRSENLASILGQRDEETPRGKKKSKRLQNLEAIDEEDNTKLLSRRVGETGDTDDEEKIGGRGARKVKKGKDEMEDKEDESVGARERRKKKTDALDSRVKGRTARIDEEESVPKRDGKRGARRSDDDADSDVMKKGGKIRGASARDKSTPNSEGRSKKETSEASTKGRRGYDSSKADDDYSKINGSRFRQRTTKEPDLSETERHHLIEYQLSDQSFVKRGWTMLPISKTMQKVVHYQTKPAKPHLNCPEGKDCVGMERKSQIVGVFDTESNGAVFDEDATTRLSYNQIGGIWRDNPAGPPLVWKWDVGEEDLPVETVYEERSTTHIEKFLVRSLKSAGSGKAASSPVSSRNKEKKVVEQKPVVAVHDSEEEVTSGFPDKHSKENPQLKMICMKLTDNISLRISNRREICLQFFAAGKNIRIELGTVLNFKKKVASHFVDTSLSNALLKCKFDDLRTSCVMPDDSLHDLVEKLREVRKSARLRKFMITKYKPYLPLRKALPKRCRL